MSTLMAFLYLLLDLPEYSERVLVTTYRRRLRSREVEHASQSDKMTYRLVYIWIDSATNYAASFETIRGDSSR